MLSLVLSSCQAQAFWPHFALVLFCAQRWGRPRRSLSQHLACTLLILCLVLLASAAPAGGVGGGGGVGVRRSSGKAAGLLRTPELLCPHSPKKAEKRLQLRGQLGHETACRLEPLAGWQLEPRLFEAWRPPGPVEGFRTSNMVATESQRAGRALLSLLPKLLMPFIIS